MNILIFDHNNDFHQWVERREFTQNFILTKNFFSPDSMLNTQHLKDAIKNAKERDGAYYQFKGKEKFKLDVSPNDDGIIVIDYPNKKLYSLSAYMAPNQIQSVIIDIYLNRELHAEPNRGAREVLENILYLLKNDIFIFDRGVEDNLIERIELYLTGGVELDKKSKNISNHDRLILNKKVVSWDFSWSHRINDYEINLAIVSCLAQKGVALCERVVENWTKFYEGRTMAEFEEKKRTIYFMSDKDKEELKSTKLTADFLVSPYIEAQRDKLSKEIEQKDKEYKMKAKI